MQRVNLNYEGEGTSIDANLALDMIMMIKIHHNQQKIALPSVGGAGQYGATKDMVVHSMTHQVFH